MDSSVDSDVHNQKCFFHFFLIFATSTLTRSSKASIVLMSDIYKYNASSFSYVTERVIPIQMQNTDYIMASAE